MSLSKVFVNRLKLNFVDSDIYISFTIKSL